jgi:hypothetical protein
MTGSSADRNETTLPRPLWDRKGRPPFLFRFWFIGRAGAETTCAVETIGSGMGTQRARTAPEPARRDGPFLPGADYGTSSPRADTVPWGVRIR